MDILFGREKNYDQVIIYRHVNPDLDAFGAQLGMYWILKERMPYTNIVLAGDMNSDLLKMFPSFEMNDVKAGKTLGIVLDTANRERIDGDISFCDKIIKIDHHIVVDSYGDINIEHEGASSCCEILALLLKEMYVDTPIKAANALYLGIIGDSNRFLYSSTTKRTFEAAIYLLRCGVNIEELYELLYVKSKKDLEITKYIYNHIQEDGNIAWYYLSDEVLKELNLTRSQGSNYVNLLSNIEEYKIWMAVTENKETSQYRVSIRSRGIAINDVANMFRGGGHAYASGATLESLDELEDLIKKLKEKING